MLEYDDQRLAGNTGFTSIPTTWYYICATMTTVGYGDHYPITPWGQFVGCKSPAPTDGLHFAGLFLASDDTDPASR